MNRRIMKGLITGGVLGMTVAMYAMGRRFHGNKTMRNKMMKTKKRVLNRAMAVAKGFSMF